jgi:hypothetical protein
MAITGTAFFIAGRILSKKLSSQGSSFVPAFILTARGIAAYFSVVVSWGGTLLPAVCIFLLFS